MIQLGRGAVDAWTLTVAVFDQTVTVTESFYPSLSFTKLFADLGGSLGLWLGVGIVQLFSYSLQFLSYLKNCRLINK